MTLKSATSFSTCLLVSMLLLALSPLNAEAASETTSALKESTYPRLGISVDSQMRIGRVHAGTPAAQAHLSIGDRIVSVNGHPVGQMDARTKFTCLVGKTGSTAQLSIERGGKMYGVTMVRTEPSPAVSTGQADLPTSPAVQSTVSPHESPHPTGLNALLIRVVSPSDKSNEFLEQILKGLAYLPDSVKRNLIDSGVTAVITPTRHELIGTTGGACYSIKTKQVVLPEYNDSTNKPSPTRRLPITILHELGHAYDNTNGRISFGAEFRELYDAEEKTVPPDQRKLLGYFLEEESFASTTTLPHKAAEECFASLFAAKYYQGTDKTLDTLRNCFPRSFSFVRTLQP